jgi:hypothetical protein
MSVAPSVSAADAPYWSNPEKSSWNKDNPTAEAGRANNRILPEFSTGFAVMAIPIIFATFAAWTVPIIFGEKTRRHESVIIAVSYLVCFITTAPFRMEFYGLIIELSV